jgi:hypothetical protein
VPGKAVSYSAAYKAFKTMLSSAGLKSDLYALHSPRIGGASDAFQNGIPSHVIDTQGRWKSSATKFAYLRFNEKQFVKNIQKSSSYSKKLKK